MKAPTLAIIVPCYNEEEVFGSSNEELLLLLHDLIAGGTVSTESYILYVDDGSIDTTWKRISAAVSRTPGEVRGIKLSHNVGHQNALLAGLEAAAADCDFSITIDVDLQDDPYVVPEMIEKYKTGSEIVFGVKRNRASDSRFKRKSAVTFYRLMNLLGADTIHNHADFRLMSNRAMKELLRYKENNLFIRGIVPHIGLPQAIVEYDRKPRKAGRSKYPLRKMVNFAIEGITSFSIRPVRMVFMIGICFTLIAIGIFIYTICRYFAHEVIEGWTSLMLSIWFCTGILLIALGIIGEYVGKIFLEVKNRPRYIIETKEGF